MHDLMDTSNFRAKFNLQVHVYSNLGGYVPKIAVKKL